MSDTFELRSLIPIDWDIKIIGDLFDLQQGKALSQKNQTGNPAFSFLRTLNILWGRLDLSTIDQMEFTNDEINRLSLKPGDILVCEGGDIGRTALWNGELDICCCQNHVHRLRARDSSIFPRFYMFWMQEAIVHLNLYGGQGNKTTIPNLSGAKLKAFQVPKPPNQEQRSIAYVLLRIQKAIGVQDRIVAATRELKKSLMQKLFTEGLHGEELKDTEIGKMPKSWMLGIFSDITEITHGQIDPKKDEYLELRSIGSENIESNTGRLISIKTVRERGLISGQYLFTKEDIVYSKIRPYLNKVVFPKFEGICSADIYPIRTKRDIMLPEFLFNYMLYDKFVTQAISFQDRTGIPKINRIQLGLLKIPIPPIETQKEISSILTNVGKRIEQAIQIREKMQTLFKSMLNLLMTGKVRVKDLEVPADAFV
jgi:type I restriction enzyme S subunit